MEWSTACVDWAERLIAGKSIIPPPIFPEQAEEALRIFRQLQVVDLGKTVWDDGLGRYRAPNFGECSEQFVFDFVAAIFGAYDAETGNQLIREFFLLISKKNTKSTIAAGIMLTAVILCWRDDEEHLILAPTKEVADNSFKPAAAMVRADEELSDLFHVQDHIRTITHRGSRASLKVVAADTETVSGKKSGKILIDEHWLFGKKVNADAMFMEATGGQISRNEGWVIILTTQSDDPPSGVFKEKLNYYRDVRDGIIVDPKSLGILYEFPPEMVASKAYLKPENFYITNPNIGRSVSIEWLEDNLRKNLPKTDGALQKFLAKHLNVEIGLALRSDAWAGAPHWLDQANPDIDLDYLIQHCEVITVGADGGGLDDLLGAAFVGRHRETRNWLMWNYAWAHPSVLARRKEIAAQLKDFENDGDMSLVTRVGDDVNEFASMVGKVYRACRLDKIGVDPSALGAILDALAAEGIPEDSITGVPQNYKLQAAIKTTERKLAGGELFHAGQPLMTWCVGNAKVETKGNAIYVTKQASGTAKIDPLMASYNAIELMSRNPESPGGLEDFLMNPLISGA